MRAIAVQFDAPQPEREPEAEEVVDCRVVALTHYLPPYMARALVHVARHVRELRVLLSTAQEPNRQFGNTWEGLDVHVQKSWMLRRPWKHAAGFRDELYVHFPYDTLRQLRCADPDIVFSYELGYRSLKSAIYCKTHRKKLALCVCVSEHTERGRGFARGMLRRLLLRLADAVTYNGPSCKRYLERFHVPENKLFPFSYSPSDLFQYAGPVARPEATNHKLLCIGQLIDRKGVGPLVESLADYCQARPHRSVELDLVGTGVLKEHVQNIPRPHNFQLRLLGHLDYRQLSQAMAEVGVLIFPTLADEWGLVVNEALQAGLPVIGSVYAQASVALIRENENGWLYAPDRASELFEKLDAMYATDAERMLALRQAAQQSVRHITSESVALQAKQMFAELMRR